MYLLLGFVSPGLSARGKVAPVVLHEFLHFRRDEIIRRTREKAAQRPVPRATEVALARGIPLFLDQLTLRLKSFTLRSDDMDASATQHGDDMLRQGFTVGQVVHGYGDVCQAVTELAFELNAPITVDEFHTLNRCLDDAIGNAVTEYGRLREESLADRGTEQLGVLAHELRNRLNTAMLSFAVLKDGAVTVGGSTGAVLERSLKGIGELIDRALADVRLETTVQRRDTFHLGAFIEEMEIAAILEAKASGHLLTVEPVLDVIVVDADRLLLAAAISNLLQNAFKFTRDGGQVWLRAHATSSHIFIEVEDECGGLPPGQADELFLPFHQRSTDRSGLGLGLSISRKAVELNGGEIRVRDLPGQGCVFTVELARPATAAPAAA